MATSDSFLQAAANGHLFQNTNFSANLRFRGFAVPPSLSKNGIVGSVVCNLGVGAVQHMKTLGAELQAKRFGQFEVLENRYICCPVSGTDERVVPQVADARQGGGEKNLPEG
jgi:hypothetical protein